MPRSTRYGRTGLPGTIRRSDPDVQATFIKAHREAVAAYGEGDRADRAAYAVLKENFEKLGDHWVAKPDAPG